jgi:hypothetical protein
LLLHIQVDAADELYNIVDAAEECTNLVRQLVSHTDNLMDVSS